MNRLPILDISSLMEEDCYDQSIGPAIRKACIQSGFFYISEHGIDEQLISELESLSKAFFSLRKESKMKIHMSKGGRSWRGYFPVGEELTSGQPDLKEGLYFGEELGPDHPKVRSQTALHGRNLFPEEIPGLKKVVLDYIDAMRTLGHRLMRGISLSLNLDPDHFNTYYTSDPFLLFRIFHYPAAEHFNNDNWGVGEHTDYGVLTILKQDDKGGLQVKSGNRWIDAPPVPGTFVCNIGDMLERMTGGYYRSTPHRVRNVSGRERLSWPFFFDPGFDALVKPLELGKDFSVSDDRNHRWDKSSVHEFSGTYGDYLLGKVSKVFPGLCREVHGT